MVDDIVIPAVSSPATGQNEGDLPRHVAVIMDGNNRWAKQRGEDGGEGHKRGAKAVKLLVKSCARRGIEALTVFAFSSENWRRPKQEVDLLMQLFLDSLQQEVAELKENGVRLEFIGELTRFSNTLQEQIQAAMIETQDNSQLVFTVAVNYGGRWDIADAARRMAEQVASGELQASAINEQLMDRYLCLANLPPVDLCIRTSGEQRISNFLLWQIAYAELYFTPCLWPDFDDQQFGQAIEDYKQRQRRFGMMAEQL